MDIKNDMGGIREYFRESKVFRWTQKELVWVRNGQGWFQLELRRSTRPFKISKPTAQNSHLKDC